MLFELNSAALFLFLADQSKKKNRENLQYIMVKEFSSQMQALANGNGDEGSEAADEPESCHLLVSGLKQEQLSNGVSTVVLTNGHATGSTIGNNQNGIKKRSSKARKSSSNMSSNLDENSSSSFSSSSFSSGPQKANDHESNNFGLISVKEVNILND